MTVADDAVPERVGGDQVVPEVLAPALGMAGLQPLDMTVDLGDEVRSDHTPRDDEPLLLVPLDERVRPGAHGVHPAHDPTGAGRVLADRGWNRLELGTGPGVSGRPLRIALVTVGDPQRMSGGFLYHQRVAERAADHDTEVRFVSLPARRFPLSVVDGPAVLRAAADSDVVVVDSLASNTLGPWLAAGRCPRPLVGSVHQGLGGIDTGAARRVVQRWSDRWSWLAASRLIVASESLALELAAAGIPSDGMCIAPSGRDGVADGCGARPDLRQGRAIAVLTVANWLDRKGITDVLDAVASMPAGAATLHLVGDEDVDARYRRRVLRRLARDDLTAASSATGS